MPTASSSTPAAEPANLVTVTSESEPPRYQVVPTPGAYPHRFGPGSQSSCGTPSPIGRHRDPHGPGHPDLGPGAAADTCPIRPSLIYSEKEGLGWHDPRGWDVYFGKTLDDLEMKISMVQAIVDQFGQKKIKPVYVNLEFLHAPYYRLER